MATLTPDEHKVSKGKEGDGIRLRCSCGRLDFLAGEQFAEAIALRHLQVVGVKPVK